VSVATYRAARHDLTAQRFCRTYYSAAFAMLDFSFIFWMVSQLVKPVKLLSSNYSTVPSQMNK
jgi:hypothetical protein